MQETDITVESLLKAIEVAKAIPKPEFDVFACTFQLWEKLKRNFSLDIRRNYDRLEDIPIYLFLSAPSMYAEAIKLENDGKKVCIIEEENGQLYYRRFVHNKS